MVAGFNPGISKPLLNFMLGRGILNIGFENDLGSPVFVPELPGENELVALMLFYPVPG